LPAPAPAGHARKNQTQTEHCGRDPRKLTCHLNSPRILRNDVKELRKLYCTGEQTMAAVPRSGDPTSGDSWWLDALYRAVLLAERALAI
jgi:hypothetical protein